MRKTQILSVRFLNEEMVGLNQVERPTILGGGDATIAAGAFPPPSL